MTVTTASVFFKLVVCIKYSRELLKPYKKTKSLSEILKNSAKSFKNLAMCLCHNVAYVVPIGRDMLQLIFIDRLLYRRECAILVIVIFFLNPVLKKHFTLGLTLVTPKISLQDRKAMLIDHVAP